MSWSFRLKQSEGGKKNEKEDEGHFYTRKYRK